MPEEDSFFSSKGRENRMEGMYKKEKSTNKICYAILYGICAVVYLVFGGLSAERASNAFKINVDFWDDVRNGHNSAYDSCSIPSFIRDPYSDNDEYISLLKEIGVQNYSDNKEGTNWTAAWNLNAVIMLLQAANFVTLAFGSFWFYPRLIGTFCNCFCACCCHLSAIIMLWSARFSLLGRLCSLNIDSSTYNGHGGASSNRFLRRLDHETFN